MATIELGDNYEVDEDSNGDLVIKDGNGNVVMKHDHSVDEWKSISKATIDNLNDVEWVKPSAGGSGIQTALDNHPIVALHPGTFSVSSPIGLPDDTHLIGSGWATLLQADPTSFSQDESVIGNKDKTNGNNRCSVRNLRIDGNDEDNSEGHIGVEFDQVSRYLIDGLYIHDTGIDGIKIRTSDYGTISNSSLDNVGNHGVFLGYGSTFSAVNNVVSKDPGTEHAITEHEGPSGGLNKYLTFNNISGTGAQNHGYFTREARHIAWTNCVAVDTNGQQGFTVEKDSGHVTENITAVNIHVDGVLATNKDAFNVDVGATDVNFYGCTSRNVDDFHYNINGDRVTISGGITHGDRPVNVGSNANHVTVNNCIFEGATNGIQLLGDNEILTDCRFVNTDSGMGSGILVENNTNVFIYDNDLIDLDSQATTTIKWTTTQPPLMENNRGWETGVVNLNTRPIPIGTGGSFSGSREFYSPTRNYHLLQPLRLAENGTIDTGNNETITIELQVRYTDGTTSTLTKTFSSSYSYHLTESDLLTLIDVAAGDIDKMNQARATNMDRLRVRAKSDQSSTSSDPRISGHLGT